MAIRLARRKLAVVLQREDNDFGIAIPQYFISIVGPRADGEKRLLESRHVSDQSISMVIQRAKKSQTQLLDKRRSRVMVEIARNKHIKASEMLQQTCREATSPSDRKRPPPERDLAHHGELSGIGDST
jgi:hypothetical protein